MLDSALSEMRKFAKRKQDGIVSATKIKILNRLLRDIRDLVKREKSAAYLDLLSEKELPQNSDAVLVLGQSRAALNSFRSSHTRKVHFKPTWITKEWVEENEALHQELDGDDYEVDDD